MAWGNSHTLAGWVALLLVAGACGSPDGERVGVTQDALNGANGAYTAQGPSPITNGQVENLTPADDVSGAIREVVAHPTDVNTLYVGTVNGGVWRTRNARAPNPTWVPLTDQSASLSIGALAMDPTNADVLLAGFGNFSSLGGIGGARAGLILSTNAGDTFTPINTTLLTGRSIAAVTIRGAVLMAGSPTGGLFRSTDTGALFTPVSGTNGLSAGGVVAITPDPSNAARYYVGVLSVGVFRSDDAGASWTNVSQNDASAAGVSQTITGGGNNNMKLAVGNDGRLFVSVQINGQLGYIGHTSDQGATWTSMDQPRVPSPGMTSTVTNASNTTPIVITTAVNHGLPLNNANLKVRLTGIAGNTTANGDFSVVAVQAADPPNQFTLAGSAGNGAYTGGGTWFRWNSLNPSKKPGGQGGIHASLAVDPTDSNGVYVGGDRQDFPNFIGATDFSGNLFRGDAAVAATGAIPSPQWEHLTHSNAVAAIPGGGTAASSAPHADSRDMVFDAGGDIIEVDDGGVFRRSSPRDNTGDWISLNGNLQITELHDIAYDPVSGILIGGAQDTGNPQQSVSNGLPWNSFTLADGGDVQVDTISSPGNAIRYTSTQNFGGARRTTFNAANVQLGAPVLLGLSPAAGSPAPQFQFVTPLELHSTNPTRLVIGAGNVVYESLDQGDTITSLAAGGGARAMAYGHPGNVDVLYVGTNAGVLVRTTAGGALAATATPFPGGGVQDLVLDPASATTAYVNGAGRVYQTTDSGGTWTDITGDLTQLPTGVLRTIIYVPGSANDKIYVGADRGLFVTSTASLGFWNEVGQALPNALVFDMAYANAIDTLFLGTMGRGAWSLASASVIDLPPVARCQDVTVEANATCQGEVAVADVDAGSFDPDGQSLTSRSLIPPGPYALGLTDVVLQVVSPGGTETCQATVFVVDTTPPVFTFVPPAVTITSCLLPDIGQALASDSCAVVVTNDAPMTFPLGTTIVTWTATDSSGNSAAATQDVTAVLDDDPSCCPTGTNIILGTSGHDTLFGTDGPDCILGRGDHDVVHGRGDSDYIAGGQGDDQLHGDDGNDYISGGADDDHMMGGAGDDYLLDLSGNDNLQGDHGNDALSGGPDDDTCNGGPGDDLIYGDDGDDDLNGGSGNDTLNGGNGVDHCRNGTILLTCE